MEVDRGPDGAERGPPEGRELQEQGTPSEKAHKPANLSPQEQKGAMNSAPKCPGGGLPGESSLGLGKSSSPALSPLGLQAGGRWDFLSPRIPPGEMPGLLFH